MSGRRGEISDSAGEDADGAGQGAPGDRHPQGEDGEEPGREPAGECAVSSVPHLVLAVLQCLMRSQEVTRGHWTLSCPRVVVSGRHCVDVAILN